MASFQSGSKNCWHRLTVRTAGRKLESFEGIFSMSASDWDSASDPSTWAHASQYSTSWLAAEGGKKGATHVGASDRFTRARNSSDPEITEPCSGAITEEKAGVPIFAGEKGEIPDLAGYRTCTSREPDDKSDCLTDHPVRSAMNDVGPSTRVHGDRTQATPSDPPGSAQSGAAETIGVKGGVAQPGQSRKAASEAGFPPANRGEATNKASEE